MKSDIFYIFLKYIHYNNFKVYLLIKFIHIILYFSILQFIKVVFN
jgi:hypothetical protein